MKKTEWYPGDVQPVRAGLYEVHRPRFRIIPKRHMLEWDGDEWVYAYELGYAGAGTLAEMRAVDQWRGLTAPAK